MHVRVFKKIDVRTCVLYAYARAFMHVCMCFCMLVHALYLVLTIACSRICELMIFIMSCCMICPKPECSALQLAPMSTTTDIATAVSYSLSNESLIFKIVTRNKLQRGADLQWLSAFPNEAEVLYPPLTYLQPTGRTQVITLNACHFTVVEVTPTIA